MYFFEHFRLALFSCLLLSIGWYLVEGGFAFLPEAVVCWNKGIGHFEVIREAHSPPLSRALTNWVVSIRRIVSKHTGLPKFQLLKTLGCPTKM
jgi:hypothetical protein